jgi:hypothetical protein
MHPATDTLVNITIYWGAVYVLALWTVPLATIYGTSKLIKLIDPLSDR